MSAWLTIELAPWWLLWEAVMVGVFATEGAIEGTEGLVGLALAAASAAGLIVMTLRRPHHCRHDAGCHGRARHDRRAARFRAPTSCSRS